MIDLSIGAGIVRNKVRNGEYFNYRPRNTDPLRVKYSSFLREAELCPLRKNHGWL